MSQLQLRPVRSDDLERIAEIESLIAGHPRRGFLEKRFSAIAANPEQFLTCAALEQGTLMGYAIAPIQEGDFGNRHALAVLDVIGVSPEAQGKGLGRAMLGGIKGQLKDRGIALLKTQIPWADRRMVQFFSSANFSLSPSQILERGTFPLEESADAYDPEIDPKGSHHSLSDDYHDLSRDRVRVRSLMPEDLEEVVRIDHKLTGRDRTPYFSAKFREMLTESGIRISLVSEEDGVLTGFVMAKVDFGAFGQVEKTAVLDSIGVHPAFKGTGLGHALLSQLMLNLATLQVESVLTQVSPEDFNLRRFLHACGFSQSQRLVLWTAVPLTPGQPAPLTAQAGVLS